MSQQNKSQLNDNIKKRLDFGKSSKKESGTQAPPEPSSLKELIKIINWKPTLILNFERSFVAGLLWAIVMTMAMGSEMGYWATFFLYLIGFPLAFMLFIMPVGLIYSYLTGPGSHKSKIGCLFAYLFVIGPTLMIIVADPIMFLIYKIKPSLIPVAKYKFLDFSLAIYVAK